MEVQPGAKRNAVGDLLTRLLSRDPVEFNSAINSNFASSVVYYGHGLQVKGASNLKHFSWLFNSLASGKAASFELKDITWSEEDNSASVRTVQYLRPRFFPVVGFAIPVQVHLRFHPDGEASKGTHAPLYVTNYQEYWPTDTFIKSLPVIGWLYQALFTPLMSFFVLALSNFLFASYASATSSKRHYIDNSVDAISVRAQKALPNELAKNVNSGFQEGTKLAEGWGTRIINVANRVSYPILSTVEHLSQQGVSITNRVSPLPLPYPYIYDAHSHPTGTAPKPFSDSQKKLPAPIVSQPPPPTSVSSPPSQDQNSDDVKPAAVQVAPALDGSDQGKTVQIPHRQNNEAEENAAPAIKGNTGTSLYDQLRRDGELPTAEDSNKLTTPSANHQTSSEEDDHQSAHGTNELPKKKKGGSKKKKAAHPHPPSFKEGLHHAEEVEQQVHEQQH